MAPFGYGIIGAGWVAPAHAWGVKALERDGVRLVGVVDIDEDRASGLAMRFDAESTYSDYQALLVRDDVHAISICLPDFLHEEVAVAAADAGKHILCEKPLAMSVESADRMTKHCQRRGVELGLVMNHRYALDNLRTKAALQRKLLGRPLVGQVMHSSALTGDPNSTSPWRGRSGFAAGGILTTQAIHFIDLLLWFLGPVEAVKAWTARLVRDEQDYEDTACLVLRFLDGSLATVATTNGAPIYDDFTGTKIEIHGTEGYVVLEGDRIREAAWNGDEEVVNPSLPELPEGASGLEFGVGHVYEVMDFVRCIRRGQGVPVSGIDGRHLMAVIFASYESAQRSDFVPVREKWRPYDDETVPSGSLLNARL